MEMMQKDIDSLKGRNPFNVPEGYFEGLEDRIMEQLPELPPLEEESEEISLFDRIKPVLYLAAVFVGLGFFFKIIAPEEETMEQSNFLLVKADAEAEALAEQEYDEDEAYWEFLEEEYLEKMMIEEFDNEQ